MRIGYMDYANVYPIFHRLLEKGGLEFKKGFPADLNNALRSGEIDVSPSSSVEFCRNPDNYKIIDGISVASVGSVKSVCLFTNFRPADISGKKIYFTKESNTSTVLCRIILEKFYNVRPVYVSSGESKDGKLLIGDKALVQYYHNDKYKYIVDLGEEWYKATGLPFVFALWLANASICEDPAFPVFRRDLLKIAEESPKIRSSLAGRYNDKGLSSAHMEDYWQVIDYSFSADYKKGLSLFYKYAFEIRETPNSNIDFEKSLV